MEQLDDTAWLHRRRPVDRIVTVVLLCIAIALAAQAWSARPKGALVAEVPVAVCSVDRRSFLLGEWGAFPIDGPVAADASGVARRYSRDGGAPYWEASIDGHVHVIDGDAVLPQSPYAGQGC